MRIEINHRKWKDNLHINLLTSEGYLTEDAKSLMREVECYTLDELLQYIEGKGKGYWFTSDLSRPDVNLRGHNAESLWGTKFRYNQGAQGGDESEGDN